MIKHGLLVSDFDQTLSFNDAGLLLSELLEIDGFREKVVGLSRLNLVQEGAELAYLLRHDPEFRRVRKQDLVDIGRRVRLKRNIPLLIRLLEHGIEGWRFDFFVVSAAPADVVRSALDGIVPATHIVGTTFGFDPRTGEIDSVTQVAAGYGKIAAVDELRLRLGIPSDRLVYVGDGSSDLHVMMQVNRGGGLTIAVSEARSIAQIAKRTIVTEDALGVLVPVLEDVVGYDPSRIRALLEVNGVLIQDWDRGRTDWLTLREDPARGEKRREAAAGG